MMTSTRNSILTTYHQSMEVTPCLIKTELRTSHTKRFVTRLERKNISTRQQQEIPGTCGADSIQITHLFDAGTAAIFTLEAAKVRGRGARLGEGGNDESF